mgnify:CR=1 FL=1
MNKVNINVDTEILITGSNNVKKKNDSIKTYYTPIKSLSINSCPSFDTFKSELKGKYDEYNTHCEIISTKLAECSNELEKIDNLIGNDVTNQLTNQNIFELGTDNISNVNTTNTYSTSDEYTINNLSNISINTSSLVNLSDTERNQLLSTLSASLTTAVYNIENGNNAYESNTDNGLVNELVSEYIQSISTVDSNGATVYNANDLTKNDFYNQVVKKYGQAANVTITPDMLHYAGRNGLPLIRENVTDYNLELYGMNAPTEKGQEYDFYTMGVVRGDEKTSQYSNELYNSTGSYQRKYTYYPDSMAYHYNSKNWYICDDGIYRDADGYIICADQNNLGYNANGSQRFVKQIIDSGDALIVDTPFGPGKVYDKCGIKENIDIYVHR